MNKEMLKKVLDAVVIAVMLILLFSLVNPFDWFMFSRVAMIALAVFICFFAIFIAAFWNEHPRDERDALHMMFSGRVAFLVGTTVTAVGIIVQSIQHTLQPWLPFILCSMVLSKYVARVYAQRRK